MNIRVLLVAALLHPSIVQAKPDSAAAQAAKKTLAAVAGLEAWTQARLILNDLSEPVYDLPPAWKKIFPLLSDPNSAPDHQELVAALLDETAPEVVQRLCKDKAPALVGQGTAAVIAKCHLKEQKLLTSRPTATLRPGSLLLSAVVVDCLRKKGASEAELTLARFLAHYERSDRDTKGFDSP